MKSEDDLVSDQLSKEYHSPQQVLGIFDPLKVPVYRRKRPNKASAEGNVGREEMNEVSGGISDQSSNELNSPVKRKIKKTKMAIIADDDDEDDQVEPLHLFTNFDSPQVTFIHLISISFIPNIPFFIHNFIPRRMMQRDYCSLSVTMRVTIRSKGTRW